MFIEKRFQKVAGPPGKPAALAVQRVVDTRASKSLYGTTGTRDLALQQSSNARWHGYFGRGIPRP